MCLFDYYGFSSYLISFNHHHGLLYIPNNCFIKIPKDYWVFDKITTAYPLSFLQKTIKPFQISFTPNHWCSSDFTRFKIDDSTESLPNINPRHHGLMFIYLSCFGHPKPTKTTLVPQEFIMLYISSFSFCFFSKPDEGESAPTTISRPTVLLFL